MAIISECRVSIVAFLFFQGVDLAFMIGSAAMLVGLSRLFLGCSFRKEPIVVVWPICSRLYVYLCDRRLTQVALFFFDFLQRLERL